MEWLRYVRASLLAINPSQRSRRRPETTHPRSEACFARGDEHGEERGRRSWTRKAFQKKRCQPFLMIPLERWNVERSGTFCDKRTVIRMVQPVVRTLIRPMARQVSRRDAKLERS